MNPELSRRAAQAMATKAMLELGPQKRFEFSRAVMDAEDFDDLSLEHKHLILESEKLSTQKADPQTESISPVHNMLADTEQRTVNTQEASLRNSIINIQEELVVAAIKKVTTNSFEDQTEVIEREDREQAEKDLAIVLAIFFEIVIMLQARSIMQRRMNEFGRTGDFEMDKTVKDYIEQRVKKGAESHVNTVVEDILTASRLATYIGGLEPIQNAIQEIYPDAAPERIAEVVRRAVVANKGNQNIAAAIKQTFDKIILEDILAATRSAALKGATHQELVSFIKAQYAKISTQRATVISRSETNRAFTQAQYEADRQFLEQNKLKAYKKWVTRSDDPCPFCIMKSEEPPIPFEKPFGEIGDVWTAIFQKADGTTSVRKLPITYETIQSGNAHPQCFCIYQLIII